MVANLMFDLPAVTVSTNTRSSSAIWLGEIVAIFGLILVILGVVRAGRASDVAFAVVPHDTVPHKIAPVPTPNPTAEDQP